MPAPQTLALFMLAALPLVLFPGPSVAFIVTTALRQGTKSAVWSTAGVEIGYLVHVAAACIGVSAVVASSATAFSILKLIGAAYLGWLALAAWRGSRRPGEDALVDQDPHALQGRRLRGHPFAQGFLVGALNPKTAIFFVAFLPQFADPARGALAPQLFVLGVVFILLACIPDFSWAFAAARMRSRIARVSRRAADRLTAGVLAVLAMSVLALQRRTN